MTDSDDSSTDTLGDAEALPDLVADLHGHLEATATLPVETRVSQWLGEAEAVAEDAVEPDVPREVVEKRVDQIGMLLSNVEGTGHEAADEHVDAARELVAEIDARL